MRTVGYIPEEDAKEETEPVTVPGSTTPLEPKDGGTETPPEQPPDTGEKE